MRVNYSWGRLDEYIRDDVELQEGYNAEQVAPIRDGTIPE
jgi:hypothetical protein